MNYGKLASTGMGTLTVGGVTLGQFGLLVVAGVLVLGGALLVRLAWRRGKSVGVR